MFTFNSNENPKDNGVNILVYNKIIGFYDEFKNLYIFKKEYLSDIKKWMIKNKLNFKTVI